MKRQKGFTLVEVLLIALIVAVLGFTGYIVWNNSKDDTSSSNNATQQIETNSNDNNPPDNSAVDDQKVSVEQPLEKGTFAKDRFSYSGSFQARGYVKTAEKQETMCDTTCGINVIASFVITELTNEYFDEYAKSLAGNSFITENSINLGCVIDGKLVGRQTFSTSDSTAILNSSNSSQIVLDFNRTTVPEGGGADNCYSHFDEISVVSTKQ